jgi:UDP-glucose 4-epimerase
LNSPFSDLIQEKFKIFRGSRVLITGGMGFLGSNLSRCLVNLGADVTIVDSLIPSYGGNPFNISDIQEQVHLNIADVRDINAMNFLVRSKDFIFNLAGQISHLDSMVDPLTDLDINCRSQLSILEACRNFNPEVKIVYAGTRQIYGNPEYLPVDEKHLVRPVDVNGINKAAGENYHLLYHTAYGMRTVSLRLTNCYGPRQWMRDNRLTSQGWFLRLVMDGKEVPIFGDGKVLRDVTYVDDVSDAFLRAAAFEETNGHFFNLGGEPHTILEQIETMIELTGRGSYKFLPWPKDKKAIAIGNYYGNYSKLQQITGWEPTITMREGLQLTIAFYEKYKDYYW